MPAARASELAHLVEAVVGLVEEAIFRGGVAEVSVVDYAEELRRPLVRGFIAVVE